MIQLYRERGRLSTGNSQNSPTNSGSSQRDEGLFQRILGGIGSGKGPGARGEGGAGKREKAGKAPRPNPQPGIWEQFSHFFFRKRVPAGIWDPFPILVVLGHYSSAKGKISSFPSLLFSSFFPLPAPLGMSSQVSECPSQGPPEFQDSGIASFPTKHTRKKTSRENKQNPKLVTKKGGFHWKSFPRPIRIWEFLGRAQRGPRKPKSPQNPTFPGDSRRDLGSSQSQSHSHISLAHREGLWGCFMYTAPIPGLGADPRILRFLGTLSSPQA